MNILITNNFIESEFLSKTNLRLGLELITALCKKILITNSSIIKVNIFLKKKKKSDTNEKHYGCRSDIFWRNLYDVDRLLLRVKLLYLFMNIIIFNSDQKLPHRNEVSKFHNCVFATFFPSTIITNYHLVLICTLHNSWKNEFHSFQFNSNIFPHLLDVSSFNSTTKIDSRKNNIIKYSYIIILKLRTKVHKEITYTKML